MAETWLEVNGRRYRWPAGPTAVITLDGVGPDYLDDGLARGRLPNLAAMLAGGGHYARGLAQMPTFTNPNNLSVVTGAPPALHGIAGNHYRTPTGEEVQLVEPEQLRAPSIHAVLQAAGGRALCVATKEKLRRLLAAGEVPALSAERAAGAALPEYGIADAAALLGPPPDIYDWRISLYALELGLAVHEAVGGLDLLYVTTTDYVQHTAAPGAPLSDALLAGVDALLGRYLAAGFRLGVTADHGMSAKHGDDGRPRVHYLSEVLAAARVDGAHVVLPITDPYVRHHGALGSFAWVWLPEAERARARETLAALPGVEEVFEREEAAVVYGHPPDRIGDLSVAADAGTALGTSAAGHDLSQLDGPLRSHGGRHEQVVPLIVSRPLRDDYATLLRAGLRNSDIHDLVLNGLA